MQVSAGELVLAQHGRSCFGGADDLMIIRNGIKLLGKGYLLDISAGSPEDFEPVFHGSCGVYFSATAWGS